MKAAAAAHPKDTISAVCEALELLGLLTGAIQLLQVAARHAERRLRKAAP